MDRASQILPGSLPEADPSLSGAKRPHRKAPTARNKGSYVTTEEPLVLPLSQDHNRRTTVAEVVVLPSCYSKRIVRRSPRNGRQRCSAALGSRSDGCTGF